MSSDAEKGKKILLGGVHREFTLPDGRSLLVRRMGMNFELQFVDLYNRFVQRVGSMKTEVVSKINDYIGGAQSIQFGVIEGLGLLGALFGQLEPLQDFMIEGLLMLAKAQRLDLTEAQIKEQFATADCFEILGAQAEAQGLLNSFRSIAAGLSTARS